MPLLQQIPADQMFSIYRQQNEIQQYIVLFILCHVGFFLCSVRSFVEYFKEY